MHVKYASRQLLYPVPNVFDGVVVIAARCVVPGLALRETDAAVRADVVFAVRDIALRARVGDFFTVVVARTTVGAAPRDVVVRDAVRDTVFAVLRVAPVRADVARVVVCWAASRVTDDVLRTAALAKPMPAQYNAAKSNVLIIITSGYNNIKNTPLRARGYL